jgi:pimeloyl-[acyl-carrier protein] methyl ester esterase
LPGLDGSGVLFRPLLSHLPSELRPGVVAYPKDKTLGYEELLPLVLAALPSPLPFVLLGESFSGPLALMAAATRPPGLMGVILCATFVRNPMWPRLPGLRHLANPMAFRFYPMVSRVKAMLGGYSTPEWRALKAEALSEVRPAVIAHRVREVLQVNVIRELASCPVPILYLRGERDRVVPAHNLREIVAARPAVEVAYFPSPHLVLQTQPVLASAAISTFVAGLDQEIRDISRGL